MRDKAVSHLTMVFEQELKEMEEKLKYCQGQDEPLEKEHQRVNELQTQLRICQGDLTTMEKRLHEYQEQEKLSEKQHQQQVAKLQALLRKNEIDLSTTKELLTESQRRESQLRGLKEGQHEVTDLRDQLKYKEEESRKNKVNLDKFREMVTRKNQKLTELEERVTELQEKLSRKKQELTKFQKRLQEHNTDKASLLAQLEEEQLRARELQNRVTTNEQKFEEQKERLRDEQQRATKLQDQLKTNERELETMRNQLNDFQVESERFREAQQRVVELQETLKRKEQELTKLQGQLQEHNTNKTSLLAQLEEEQQRAGELQNRVTTNEQEFEELKERLRDEQQRATKLQDQLTALQSQLRTREGEISLLREQLNESRQEERIRDLEKEEVISELRRQLTGTEQELRTVRQQFREFQRQEEQRVTEFQRQLATSQLELEGVREQLNGTQQREWVINQNDIQITEHEIGRGAWGVVYRGKFHGCDVAMKQMHQEIASDYTRQSFEREVSMASKCRHPCLLQFIGATTDERPLLVTEILDSSLKEKLYGDVPSLSANEVSVISRDVALGLNYLHQRPTLIIHHDVSSGNVLLWRQGARWRAKLSDYGTANFVRQSNIRYAGNASYVPPELRDEHQDQPISCKVDVYSFGVLLCEMCIRQQPNPQQRRRQIARIRNCHFRELVQRCVEEEPGARPNMEQTCRIDCY